MQLTRARSDVDTATHPAKGREAGNVRSEQASSEKPDSSGSDKVTKLESVKESTVESVPEPQQHDAPSAEAPIEDSPEHDDSVGDLFASLRSETPKVKPSESSKSKSSKPKKPTAKKSTAKKSTAKKSTSKKASKSSPEVEVDSSEMTRRLKRVLADEQSRAMSTIKSAEDLPSLTDLLNTVEVHAELYWVEVLGQLDDVSHGTDAVREPVRSLVEDIRRRVTNALDAADGDSESAVNALRSVYREVKTQKVVTCADAVCRTAGVGASS